MEHENLNTPQTPPLQQTAVSGSAYLIKLGHFIDSGYLDEVGTNEEAISKIILDAAKRNDLPGGHRYTLILTASYPPACTNTVLAAVYYE
jgi:hypothetical protein